MKPSTLTVKEKYSNQEYSVQVVKNQSVKIDCTYLNHREPKPTSVTFKIADAAEYNSYNTSFIGIITAISDKVVTIRPRGDNNVVRLKMNNFCSRNWDFNFAKKVAENNEISMTI